MRIQGIVLLGAAGLAGPAAGAVFQYSAVVQQDIGYGSNPFLRPGVIRGGALLSFSVAPKLLYQTSRSMTAISGTYDRDKYTNHFGYTDALNAALNRTDQLSQHLVSTIAANYSTTNKATVADPADPNAIDPLDIGRRTNRITASSQLQWQATARDTFSYGTNISHLSYGGSRAFINGIASDYTQVGVDGSYNRTINARTSVGVQANMSSVKSKLYPHSRSIQPSLTIKRQLTAVWTLDGHVGLVLQQISGPFARSSTSLGYGVTTCATYPRTHVCATAERASAPSGYGGLRTSSSLSLNVSQTVSARSRVTLAANFNKSSSTLALPTVAVPSGRSIAADAEYDHDLTQRLSWGFTGRYQWRDAARTGIGRAVTATVHITAKLGRI